MSNDHFAVVATNGDQNAVGRESETAKSWEAVDASHFVDLSPAERALRESDVRWHDLNFLYLRHSGLNGAKTMAHCAVANIIYFVELPIARVADFNLLQHATGACAPRTR